MLIDPSADPKRDRVAACHGRVLGGGTVVKPRSLGLVLTPNYQSVRYMPEVATAINRRFHTAEKGIQTGVAKAKTDEYIELTVHPRYKDNIARYLRVVKAVPLKDLTGAGSTAGAGESAAKRMQRLKGLRGELLDPETSADAAIALEAIGNEGKDALLSGLNAKEIEVRFYAAEALAYLDCRDAAAPLAQIARDEPAFRVFALGALRPCEEYAAYEQLRELLPLPSAETRYGAFRSLWAMNPNDPLIKGETFGESFRYHVLNVGGPPMIHLTYSRLAEIVIFGPDQRLLTPLAINAGKDIMVTGFGGDQIAGEQVSGRRRRPEAIVSHQGRRHDPRMVDLGGTYADVIQALQEAKRAAALPSRLEIDALPEAGRPYDRPAEDQVADAGQHADPDAAARHAAPRSPAPDLFCKQGDKNTAAGRPWPRPAKRRQPTMTTKKPLPRKVFLIECSVGKDV